MSSEYKYRQAKKIVNKKKNFYRHFSVYAVVMLFLFSINMITLDPFHNGFWFLFPLLAWGMPIAIHYLAVFGFPGKQKVMSPEWEEREIEKEMYNLGGEVEDDYLELNERKILQRQTNDTNWKENDLV